MIARRQARLGSALVGSATAVAIGLTSAPAAQAAPASVPQRSAVEVARIDNPEPVALPDGRVLVGWTNGNNMGDTTLAMVRPAGGLLPSTPQVLRGGISGESLAFTPGGPAANPVVTSWQDGETRTPYRVALDGDRFTTQTAIFSGTGGLGRFPRYARCPDGSMVFAYQYTILNPPSPVAYFASGYRADANGAITSGGVSASATPDTFQDPTVTCDRGVKLYATAIDGDGTQGGGLPERLRVSDLGAGGALLDRDPFTANSYASAPNARVAPDGRVWILWTESESAGANLNRAYLATRAPGVAGAATADPTPILTSASAFVGPLFFDAAGNTHLLITREVAGVGYSYGIRTAPAGGAAFGPEQELLAADDQDVQLLLDHPDGNPRLLVSKEGPTPGSPSTYSVRGIPQAGSGNATTPLTFDAGFVRATYLPTGDLFALGVRDVSPGVVQLVEGGIDTGAPPTIDAVDVPGLAAAGEATTIAATAKDPMGLASFGWTVSGGSLAAPITLGTQQATIPGLAPGTYTVQARAVDRVGGSAEITRTLRVLDPAAVTPGTAAFADAVAKAGGTLSVDNTAPKVSAFTAQRGRKGKAKRTVTVSVRVNEAASVDLELIGTLKRGGQQGTLVLKSGRIASVKAGAAGGTKLAIPASLAKLVGNTLRVRATVTDLAGNRSQQTITVKVAK